MPQLTRLPATASTTEIMAVLNRDGALIIKDMLNNAEVDRLNGELMPYVHATKPGRDAFSGFKTTRTGALVARSPETRKLIMHKMIRAIADEVLLPNCVRYHLHLTHVIRIMPGQEAQPIHRDRSAWGPYFTDIEPQLNTIWALTDFTKENGATQVVPGSSPWPDTRRPTDDQITYAEMNPGSVLIYTGSVLHGGGANVTNADRVGLNLTYSLGWLRQEENQYLSCPPEIAKTLEPDLQKLIGYTMGSYGLGYYTPPLPPGAGPETVAPEFACGASAEESRLGSQEMLDAIVAQMRRRAGRA